MGQTPSFRTRPSLDCNHGSQTTGVAAAAAAAAAAPPHYLQIGQPEACSANRRQARGPSIFIDNFVSTKSVSRHMAARYYAVQTAARSSRRADQVCVGMGNI